MPFYKLYSKRRQKAGAPVPSNRIKRQQEERNRKPVTFVNCSLLTALRATGSEGEDAERSERPNYKEQEHGGGGGGQKAGAAHDPFSQSLPAYSKVRLQWCINTTQKSPPLKILPSAVQNRACLDYRMGRMGRQ